MIVAYVEHEVKRLLNCMSGFSRILDRPVVFRAGETQPSFRAIIQEAIWVGQNIVLVQFSISHLRFEGLKVVHTSPIRAHDSARETFIIIILGWSNTPILQLIIYDDNSYLQNCCRVSILLQSEVRIRQRETMPRGRLIR
jgi:hypothetical protein